MITSILQKHVKQRREDRGSGSRVVPPLIVLPEPEGKKRLKQQCLCSTIIMFSRPVPLDTLKALLNHGYGQHSHQAGPSCWNGIQ